MKFAFEGGNSWDWKTPIDTLCRRKGIGIATLFADAAAWAKNQRDETIFVISAPAGTSHAGRYLDEIRWREPPTVPLHVRKYVAHELQMRNVAASAVTVRPLVAAPVPAKVRRAKVQRFHRPAGVMHAG